MIVKLLCQEYAVQVENEMFAVCLKESEFCLNGEVICRADDRIDKVQLTVWSDSRI